MHRAYSIHAQLVDVFHFFSNFAAQQICTDTGHAEWNRSATYLSSLTCNVSSRSFARCLVHRTCFCSSCS
eukprot:209995-Lingulodinium_polyedra.AAC.1